MSFFSRGLILTLLLLPSVKGTIVALQWALYMHGFEDAWRPGQPKPIARPT